MSKENAIPFWAYCQSTNIRFITIADSMGHYTYTEHPEAKKEYLRYEAFNALALGAKAITYWRYSYREDGNHPDTVGTTYEHYISSLTDKNGKPTTTNRFLSLHTTLLTPPFHSQPSQSSPKSSPISIHTHNDNSRTP